jgi:type I restriction enzyme S subunit
MQKDKQLLPSLRFSEFQFNWESKNLRDLSSLITKGTTPKQFTHKGVNYVKIEGLEGININKSKCLYIDESTHSKELKRSVLKKNDLLFAIAGATIGKVGVVTDDILPANTNQALSIIRLEDNDLLDFIIQVLQSRTMKKYIYQNISIGAQPNLNLEQIGNFRFNIPKLNEQQKIASFLTVIDNRIQTLEKKKTLLEQYKKGVMQKIFKQELRFKDDTSTSLSTSDGKAFPDWEEKKLGKLTYKVGKKNKENISYPIYSINNQEGFRPQSEQFEGLDSNDRGYDISLYKIVNKETFAYNPARINVGSIGYSFELNEVIISSLYVCFKTNKELEDLYLLAYLDTNKFNKNILRYEEGGVRQYLFYENFSQIKIPLPSNAEQTKIANFLSAIDRNIELVTTKIEHTKTYKKGLLQQMFV